MKESSRYYVIGLWRVWDRGSTAGDPYHRAPDALVQRLGGIFEQEPNDETVSDAIADAERGLSCTRDCEFFERAASIVVGDLGWTAMRERSVWAENDAVCRHTASPNNVVLHIYGLDPGNLRATKGVIWEPAKADVRSLDAVCERLRRLGDKVGLEPVPAGVDVPLIDVEPRS